MLEFQLSARASNSPVLSRFVGAQALLAAEAMDRFEGSLLGLAQNEHVGEMLSEHVSDDGFWPEPTSWKAAYRPYIVVGGVLQIPVKGILLSDFSFAVGSFATGYTYLRRALARGLDDPNVRGVAWLVDTGGGEVQECMDLCDYIFGARGKKPMRAFCEFAYSAGYAIASSVGPVIVTRTGGVGSIGVVTMHVDMSKALSDNGVKITLIDAPKGGHKTDTYPYKPLSAAGEARLQQRTDALYQIFVETAARNRGIGEQEVRATKALTYMVDQAIEVGLADKMGVVVDEVTAFAADLSTNEGNEDMSEAAKTYSQAQFDQAVAAARTEGHAAGVAEGKNDTETAVANAKAEGAKGERERIKAVTSLEEAKGREAQALAIAVNTDMSAEQAKTVLAVSPKATAAGGGRAGGAALGLAVETGGQPDASAGAMTPDEVAASINKQFGGKR